MLETRLEYGLISFHLKTVIAWFNGDVESHNVWAVRERGDFNA